VDPAFDSTAGAIGFRLGQVGELPLHRARNQRADQGVEIVVLQNNALEETAGVFQCQLSL